MDKYQELINMLEGLIERLEEERNKKEKEYNSSYILSPGNYKRGTVSAKLHDKEEELKQIKEINGKGVFITAVKQVFKQNKKEGVFKSAGIVSLPLILFGTFAGVLTNFILLGIIVVPSVFLLFTIIIPIAGRYLFLKRNNSNNSVKLLENEIENLSKELELAECQIKQELASIKKDGEYLDKLDNDIAEAKKLLEKIKKDRETAINNENVTAIINQDFDANNIEMSKAFERVRKLSASLEEGN